MSPKRSEHTRPHVKNTVSASNVSRGNDRGRSFGGYRVDGNKDGLRVSLPGGEEVLLTRRHFMYGLAAVAAFGVVSASSYALDQMRATEASERVLAVPTTSVFTTDECTYLEADKNPVKLQHELQLPYGTQVWSSTDSTAVCLIPTDSSRPLTQVGIIMLSTGAYTTVLEGAVSAAEGYEIYDVRACDSGVVWTESNILKGDWRIYQAPLTLGAGGNGTVPSASDPASAVNYATTPTLGEAHLCAEGGGNWEMPALAAADAYAWWQELPRLNTEASQENSLLKRVRFGSTGTDSWEMVYSSEGRMATVPTATTTGVIITPRANTDLVNYQLTYLDAADGEVIDTLILPSSMRPIEAAYGRTGFSFAFDGIYDYGGGIANLGTYVPVGSTVGNLTDPVEAAAHYGSCDWFRYPRTPLCAPAWCGPYFMVKSTNAVVGVNLDAREYFALDVRDGAGDYGDYLASTGMGNRIVTFSNIDYTPLNGAQEKYSLVRIWGL